MTGIFCKYFSNGCGKQSNSGVMAVRGSGGGESGWSSVEVAVGVVAVLQ